MRRSVFHKHETASFTIIRHSVFHNHETQRLSQSWGAASLHKHMRRSVTTQHNNMGSFWKQQQHQSIESGNDYRWRERARVCVTAIKIATKTWNELWNTREGEGNKSQHWILWYIVYIYISFSCSYYTQYNWEATLVSKGTKHYVARCKSRAKSQEHLFKPRLKWWKWRFAIEWYNYPMKETCK